MTSINTSTSLMIAKRMHDINLRDIVTSLERLATGRRINRGSDDPAGLIASENLMATLKALEAEGRSLQRSDHVANVADGAMASVSDLLVEANGLAVAAANSAGMSDEERQAIQMQLDSTLDTIDRIAGTTTFNGDPLLDGTATITAGDTSVDIPSTYTGSLGETDIDGTTYTLADLRSGGSLNVVNGDVSGAQQVIKAALNDVTTARGTLGSFQRYTVGARLEAIGVAMENTAAANSLIRDTDYAEETVNLNRSMLLQQASLTAIGIITAQRSSILALLGDA